MNETHRRPWWRLHWLTLITVIVLATSFVQLNITQANRWYRNIPIFGWPLKVVHDPSDVYTFSGIRPGQIYIVPFIGNIALAAFVTMGAAWTVERWCRRLNVGAQFSLKILLVVTASLASYTALRDKLPDPWFLLTGAELIVILQTIPLAWIAVFDLIGIAWNWLESRRRVTEAIDPDSASPVEPSR